MLEVSKKEAIDQLQQVVDQADERLRELQAEVEDATGDARYQLETAIARIKKERQKVIDQIKRVSEASTLTWKDIKSESDDLVREAENTVNGTTNKVRELFTEDEKE